MRIPDGKVKCEFPHEEYCDEPCENVATEIHYDRRSEKILLLCSSHDDYLQQFDSCEYSTNCPNCGCFDRIN